MIQTLGVGDYFGELALLMNMKRSATCVLDGYGEFVTLKKNDF